MTPFRKTIDGIVVTESTVKFWLSVFGIVGTLLAAGVAATRFYARAADAPTRMEFVEHVTRDSITHAGQAIHSAFQDSVIARQGFQNHALSCYIAKYPPSLCADVIPQRTP